MVSAVEIATAFGGRGLAWKSHVVGSAVRLRALDRGCGTI
jgi:hypothetical protein